MLRAPDARSIVSYGAERRAPRPSRERRRRATQTDRPFSRTASALDRRVSEPSSFDRPARSSLAPRGCAPTDRMLTGTIVKRPFGSGPESSWTMSAIDGRVFTNAFARLGHDVDRLLDAAELRRGDLEDSDARILPNRTGVALEVQRGLMTRVAGGDTRIEALARQLAMSPRTLQRRLAAEGVSYQQFLED